ncbi:twitching motility protein PilT [Rhizobium rhizosphaerae]|uniref:Twitching motility protein PilT n=1 Tax=Xaviernesmea rhizosphaerae TaxID=1672749 RepID=A0A1Q9AP60_9HYPH|nr:type II toxin-antitoxin system VapC family toxin [Xaviernesmea rhizosphaerae]OLP57222.1 twitching motility protein PilT [Xaviernesmea rhizosphaerae]
MRLLLDTHILISILMGSTSRLPANIRAILDPLTSGRLGDEDEIFVSVATLWEMAIKVRLGKLGLGVSIDILPDVIARLGLTILPVEASHALFHVQPEPPTRDPFDRLLLAQCAIEGLRLVTTDHAMADHPLSATHNG